LQEPSKLMTDLPLGLIVASVAVDEQQSDPFSPSTNLPFCFSYEAC